jgi:hypothetical protein
MELSKKPLYILIIISLIVILTSTVYAATESINVEPRKEITRAIDLATGDRTSITVRVLGPAPSTIHFYVVLPNGTTDDRGDLSHCELSFSTDVKGECQLHFDNVNSSNAQLVTLNYEVEHFIFGIPQMMFLLIAITVLLLFVAAGYVAMGKYGELYREYETIQLT